MKTLQELRQQGRDPLVMFRAEEALLIDSAWVGRVVGGAPVMFWDGDELPMARADYTVDEGVATVRVEGALAQRGYLCFEGYDTVARKLGAALDDKSVTSVVLVVNSPGGAAAGAFEAVRSMRERVEASGKPVVAYSDEMAFSGGYAIACIADEIVVPETGGVGSVGVIAGLQSIARKLATDGIDVRVLASGAEKADGHPALPIDEKAVARAQARVDELAGVFHRLVASRRNMTPEAVKALEAGVRYGASAVSSGLADRVASYSATVASLKARKATNKAPIAPSRGTTAARVVAPSTTRSRPMNEQLIAALAETLGTTDPTDQITALAKMSEKVKAHDTAVEAAATARRDLVIAQGRFDRKLTPGQMEWAKTQTAESLTAFLASAPVQLPAPGDNREANTDTKGASAAISAIAAKPWKELTSMEKVRLRDEAPEVYRQKLQNERV